MADATGVSASFAFASAFARGENPDPTDKSAPDARDHRFHGRLGTGANVWSAGRAITRKLVDGGGQWNGNIPTSDLPQPRSRIDCWG